MGAIQQIMFGTVGLVSSFTLSDTDLDMGDQIVGDPRGMQSGSFTITQQGAPVTGTISIADTGFSVNPSSFSLSNGGSQIVQIYFNAPDVDFYNGTVTINSNATTNPIQTVSVSANGISISASVNGNTLIDNGGDLFFPNLTGVVGTSVTVSVNINTPDSSVSMIHMNGLPAFDIYSSGSSLSGSFIVPPLGTYSGNQIYTEVSWTDSTGLNYYPTSQFFSYSS
jgi:hypothetical protein